MTRPKGVKKQSKPGAPKAPATKKPNPFVRFGRWLARIGRQVWTACTRKGAWKRLVAIVLEMIAVLFLATFVGDWLVALLYGSYQQRLVSIIMAGIVWIVVANVKSMVKKHRLLQQEARTAARREARRHRIRRTK